jgi:hypothetical protein
MTADGRDPVQVTRTGGFAPLVSADGKHLYYQKTQGYSDIWTTPVGGGKYEGHRPRQPPAVRRESGWDLLRSQRRGGPAPAVLRLRVADAQGPGALDGGDRPRADRLTRWPLRGVTQPDQYGSDLMLVERFQ